MTGPQERPSLRHRLFADFMAKADDESHRLYAEKKQALLSALRGRVLEIGPGTGVNLRYLSPEVTWIGVEPNTAMHPHLRAEAERLGLAVELHTGMSEALGVEAGSVDIVLSTLVLCSVSDMRQVMAEVQRVLKPGGRFVFLEHVADRRWTFRWMVQKPMPFTPWRFFSDGCDPGRDIGAVIAAAGFEDVDCTPYMQDGPGIILAINRPHIWGSARKRTTV